MIQILPGSAFWRTPTSIRVNAVNCHGVMGRGIALEFAKRYPAMFKNYVAVCQNHELIPGMVWQHQTEDGEIWNAATKDHWKEKSEYEWIGLCLDEIAQLLRFYGTSKRIAIPALGCGLGGLEWQKVSDLVGDKLDGTRHQVMLFAPLNQKFSKLSIA